MKFLISFFLTCLFIQEVGAQNQEQQQNIRKSTPETEFYRQQISDQVLKQLNKIDWQHVGRTTGGSTPVYTIPVVVHVLHNYGEELVSDSSVFSMIATLNSFFLKTNADTADIIDKYKSVAASTGISFKLATLDSSGNPTRGIEHIYTYLSYIDVDVQGLFDQCMINQWPPDRYLNIWVRGYIDGFTGGGGYGISSYTAAYYPYYDGVVSCYYSNFLSRYVAEYLNLPSPCPCCGATGCVDGDGIADTPPCDGEYYTCANIYDSVCDTPNVQNIMTNEGECDIMFTYGQGQYMQDVLQLDFAGRDSLITPYTYSLTGMDQPMPDMLPVADFSIGSPYATTNQPFRRFFLQGQSMTFKNQSWNDTVIAATWAFTHEPETVASNSLTTVANKFYQPGWATIILAVTGNNTGVSTTVNTIFIADSVATPAMGFTQEFNPGAGMDNWPMFNYYNNGFQWQMGNVGYFDSSCLVYSGYDTRTFPQNMTGSPQGDVDDVFTPVFDLTGFADSCYLNFMSSGATITDRTAFMNDSLEIDYSVNNALTWARLSVLKGAELDNKGTVTVPYAPLYPGDWVAHSFSLPAAAKSTKTIFRLRYYPGADSAGISTGNNFYLDNFNFNSAPESVAITNQMSEGVTLQPNPTSANSYVIIKASMAIPNVSIEVTDITGKMVYKTTSLDNSNIVRIEIPADMLTVKGVYLVHVITDHLNQTQKLEVY